MNPHKRIRGLTAVLLAFAALVGTALAHEIDEVALDTASGVFARGLPFDVPFVIIGTAPPGTVRVELFWEIDPAAGSQATPRGPLVSGFQADGSFRILMDPVRPDHQRS